MRGCTSACSIPPTLRSNGRRKMVHKLAIVAIAGITISAVCLGAGGALEGRDFSRDFTAGGGFAALFDGDRPRCETESGGDVITSRDLDWDGSDHVGLS